MVKKKIAHEGVWESPPRRPRGEGADAKLAYELERLREACGELGMDHVKAATAALETVRTVGLGQLTAIADAALGDNPALGGAARHMLMVGMEDDGSWRAGIVTVDRARAAEMLFSTRGGGVRLEPQTAVRDSAEAAMAALVRQLLYDASHRLAGARGHLERLERSVQGLK